jgi:hypothetical protein
VFTLLTPPDLLRYARAVSAALVEIVRRYGGQLHNEFSFEVGQLPEFLCELYIADAIHITSAALVAMSNVPVRANEPSERSVGEAHFPSHCAHSFDTR